MEEFECIKCGRRLPRTTEFFYRRPKSDKLHNSCKLCFRFQVDNNKAKKTRAEINAERREYVNANREKVYATSLRWREKNREKIRLSCKRYRLSKAMNK